MKSIINYIKERIKRLLPRYLQFIKKHNLFFVLFYFSLIFLGIFFILELKINYQNQYNKIFSLTQSSQQQNKSSFKNKVTAYYEITIKNKNTQFNNPAQLISLLTEAKNKIKKNQFLNQNTKYFYDIFPTWLDYKLFFNQANQKQIQTIHQLIQLRKSTNANAYPFLIKAIDEELQENLNDSHSFLLKGSEFFPFKKKIKHYDYLIKRNKILLLIEPKFSYDNKTLNLKYLRELKKTLINKKSTTKKQTLLHNNNTTYQNFFKLSNHSIKISINGLPIQLIKRNNRIFYSIVQSIVIFLFIMSFLILLFFRIKNALLIILLPLILSLVYSFILPGIIYGQINIHHLIIISLMAGINGSYGYKLYTHFRTKRLEGVGISEALIMVFKNLGYKIAPFFFFIFLFFLLLLFNHISEFKKIGQFGMIAIILAILSYSIFFPVFVFFTEKWKKSSSPVVNIIKGKYQFIAAWIVIILILNGLGIWAIFSSSIDSKPILLKKESSEAFIEKVNSIQVKYSHKKILEKNHSYLNNNSIQVYSLSSFYTNKTQSISSQKELKKLNQLLSSIPSKEKIYLDINHALKKNQNLTQLKIFQNSIYQDNNNQYNLWISQEKNNLNNLKNLCRQSKKEICQLLNKKYFSNQNRKITFENISLNFIQNTFFLMILFLLIYIVSFKKISFLIFLLWPLFSSLLSIYGLVLLICNIFNLNNYYFIHSMFLNLPIFISLSFGLAFILSQQVKLKKDIDIRQIMHKIGNNIFFPFIIIFIGYISLIFIDETILITIGFTGSLGAFIIYYHYSILYPLSVRFIRGM